MTSSIRNKPIYRFFIWFAIVACSLSIAYILSTKGSIALPFGDSVNYWAAGKLMVSGNNPYSQEEVLKLRHEAGNFREFSPNAISMMLYPPWTIPFTLPLGLFDYPMARLVWLLFHIIIITICAKSIWLIYGGSRNLIIVPYLITILFAPTIFVLATGHITSLLLLGTFGFIYFLHKPDSNNRNYFLAGISASLALIKPQVLYLFLFALLLWIIRNRKWMVLLAGIVSLSVLTMISLVINQQVITQYWQALTSYPVGRWATPTFGMLLRLIFGLEKEWLQILPSFFGASWLLLYWRKHCETWDWLNELPLILLICVVTSPYIWSNDMIVLLIPVIAMMVNISKTRFNWQSALIIIIFILINLVRLSLHHRYNEFWHLWFPPTLLILYWAARKITRNKITNQYIVNMDKVS